MKYSARLLVLSIGLAGLVACNKGGGGSSQPEQPATPPKKETPAPAPATQASVNTADKNAEKYARLDQQLVKLSLDSHEAELVKNTTFTNLYNNKYDKLKKVNEEANFLLEIAPDSVLIVIADGKELRFNAPYKKSKIVDIKAAKLEVKRSFLRSEAYPPAASTYNHIRNSTEGQRSGIMRTNNGLSSSSTDKPIIASTRNSSEEQEIQGPLEVREIPAEQQSPETDKVTAPAGSTLSAFDRDVIRIAGLSLKEQAKDCYDNYWDYRKEVAYGLSYDHGAMGEKQKNSLIVMGKCMSRDMGRYFVNALVEDLDKFDREDLVKLASDINSPFLYARIAEKEYRVAQKRGLDDVELKDLRLEGLKKLRLDPLNLIGDLYLFIKREKLNEKELKEVVSVALSYDNSVTDDYTSAEFREDMYLVLAAAIASVADDEKQLEALFKQILKRDKKYRSAKDQARTLRRSLKSIAKLSGNTGCNHIDLEKKGPTIVKALNDVISSDELFANTVTVKVKPSKSGKGKKTYEILFDEKTDNSIGTKSCQKIDKDLI